MAYKRIKLDLTNVIAVDAPVELIPQGRKITSVFILKFPVGVGVQLRLGQQGADFIDVDQPIVFEPSGEDANSGLYWANAVAVPGQSVILYVATDKPALNPDGLTAIAPPSRGSPPPYGGVTA